MLYTFNELIHHTLRGNWAALENQPMDALVLADIPGHGTTKINLAGYLALHKRLDLAMLLVNRYKADPKYVILALFINDQRKEAEQIARALQLDSQIIVLCLSQTSNSETLLRIYTRSPEHIDAAIMGAAFSGKTTLLTQLLNLEPNHQHRPQLAAEYAAKGGHRETVQSLRAQYAINICVYREALLAAGFGHEDYVNALKPQLEDVARYDATLSAVSGNILALKENLDSLQRTDLIAVLAALMIRHYYDAIILLLREGHTQIANVICAAIFVKDSNITKYLPTLLLCKDDAVLCMSYAAQYGCIEIMGELIAKFPSQLDIVTQKASFYGQTQLVSYLVRIHKATLSSVLEGLTIKLLNIETEDEKIVFVKSQQTISALFSASKTYANMLKATKTLFQKVNPDQEIPASLLTRLQNIYKWIETNQYNTGHQHSLQFWGGLLVLCVSPTSNNNVFLQTALTRHFWNVQEDSIRAKQTWLAYLKTTFKNDRPNYLPSKEYFKQKIRPFILTLYLTIIRLNNTQTSLPPFPVELLDLVLEFCFYSQKCHAPWHKGGGTFDRTPIPKLLTN